MNDRMEITSMSALGQRLKRIKKLVPEFEFTSGTLAAIAVSVLLFLVTRFFNMSHDVFTLGTSVVFKGHVHKLLTYSFFHEDWGQLLLSTLVLLPFCSGLEKSVGTVRFLYLLLLLSAWTGLTHVLLELLLLAPDARSHVQGFIPVSLAFMGMATIHSRMRRVMLMGVSLPTVALPWIFVIVTLIVPGTVFLCNIIAVLVGEIYGMGWFSLLDMSEARASVLDKKMPFRLLRRLGMVLYVPASQEERRKTLHPPYSPAPGSYPVQAYAPLSSLPSTQGAEALPQMYEGWQHSTYTDASHTPPSLYHGHSHAHGCGHGHSHAHGCGHGHTHSYGHSHGQMTAHQTSTSWIQGTPAVQAYSSASTLYVGHVAPTPPSGLPASLPDPLVVPGTGHYESSVPSS